MLPNVLSLLKFFWIGEKNVVNSGFLVAAKVAADVHF